MNCGPKGTTELLNGLKQRLSRVSDDVDVLVCPPFVSLPIAAGLLTEFSGVRLGAQNVHFEDNGAYTGEISTQMLKEVGCSHVIVGHSERREYFGETDQTVNTKVRKLLRDGLVPVVCVGETLTQRKSGAHVKLVQEQVRMAFNEVDEDRAQQVVVAYEPIWAIGTGETASPDQAQEMHELIRDQLGELFDEDTADEVQILYGGSMKPHNAEELLGQPDVDGGLIGGASLKADSFAEIIEIADKLCLA
jgi:triosephosphate isomerase